MNALVSGETIVFADGLNPETTVLNQNLISGVNYLNLSGSNITSMKLTKPTQIIYLNINNTGFTELQEKYLKELQVICANNTKLGVLKTRNLG